MRAIENLICSKRTIQILQALSWAAVIIGCSFILGGAETTHPIRNILIMGASFNLLLLHRKFSKKQPDNK